MGIKEELQEVKNKINEVRDESLAMQLLEDFKRQNKRQFIVILVILGLFTCLLGYTIYLLNDINTEETIITQDNADGYNNYIGNDGDIYNGKTND